MKIKKYLTNFISHDVTNMIVLEPIDKTDVDHNL